MAKSFGQLQREVNEAQKNRDYGLSYEGVLYLSEKNKWEHNFRFTTNGSAFGQLVSISAQSGHKNTGASHTIVYCRIPIEHKRLLNAVKQLMSKRTIAVKRRGNWVLKAPGR